MTTLLIIIAAFTTNPYAKGTDEHYDWSLGYSDTENGI